MRAPTGGFDFSPTPPRAESKNNNNKKTKKTKGKSVRVLHAIAIAPRLPLCFHFARRRYFLRVSVSLDEKNGGEKCSPLVLGTFNTVRGSIASTRPRTTGSNELECRVKRMRTPPLCVYVCELATCVHMRAPSARNDGGRGRPRGGFGFSLLPQRN